MKVRGVIIIVLAWVCAMGGFAYVMSLNLRRGSTKLALVGVVVPPLLITTGVVAYYDRQRRRELAQGLLTRGYVTNESEGGAPQVLHYRKAPNHREFRALHSALGIHNGRPAHTAEYEIRIGGGKSSHALRVLEVALDLPVGLPAFALTPHLGLAQRPLGKIFTSAPSPVDDAAFNKRWTVDCNDPVAATAVLSPAVVAFVRKAPRHELAWRIENGWISCSWYKRPTVAEIDAGLARVEEMAVLVEAALAEGGPVENGMDGVATSDPRDSTGL